jgi:cytochrome c-type biogenesis protein CcmH
MTTFIVVAALLVACALVLLVPPLFGAGMRRMAKEDAGAYQARTALAVLREQLVELEAEHKAERISDADYARTREELEKRALDEGEADSTAMALKPARALGIALMVLVPALAALVYWQTGTPAGLDPANVVAQAEPRGPVTQDQIEAMVSGLAERLKQDPGNPEGWFMLARSYNALGRFSEAAQAYGKLAELVPDEAQVFADWADALAASNGRNLTGEPEKLIAKALELDPNNVKALALSGSVAFQKSDFARASSEWERILVLLPPENELAQSIRQGIAEARQRGNLPPLAELPAAATGAGVTLSGELSLAPALAAKAQPGDTVFIFVRPVGGGMPFAVLRRTVADLPVKFDFNGVPSMAGNRPIPAEVSIGARVSKSGSPGGAPGDLEAAAVTVKPDASGINLVLDSEIGSAPVASAPAGSAAGITLSGQLSLSPDLAQKAAPEDVVFIFVSPVGGGMPFAVLRYTVGDLPLSFDFNGAPSMAGNRPIPAEVSIGARISKSGRAGAAPGDLEAPVLTVKPDAGGVDLVLDHERT